MVNELPAIGPMGGVDQAGCEAVLLSGHIFWNAVELDFWLISFCSDFRSDKHGDEWRWLF
jgi:hypothetical protein